MMLGDPLLQAWEQVDNHTGPPMGSHARELRVAPRPPRKRDLALQLKDPFLPPPEGV